MSSDALPAPHVSRNDLDRLPPIARRWAPAAIAELDKLDAAAWQSVDPVELELCRLRIAALLGDVVGERTRTAAALEAGLTEERVAELARWWASDAFSPREKARLGYTEQFVVSVSSMGDDEIEALLRYDDHVAVYEFTMAIYVLDMTTRVSVMLRGFDEENEGEHD